MNKIEMVIQDPARDTATVYFPREFPGQVIESCKLTSGMVFESREHDRIVFTVQLDRLQLLKNTLYGYGYGRIIKD